MNNVSFGSTFRIPLTQNRVNKPKRNALKILVQEYGGLVPSGNKGAARVSIADKQDAGFIGKMKQIGIKTFQIFKGENIPNSELDTYIKPLLDNRKYRSVGQQMKPKKHI